MLLRWREPLSDCARVVGVKGLRRGRRHPRLHRGEGANGHALLLGVGAAARHGGAGGDGGRSARAPGDIPVGAPDGADADDADANAGRRTELGKAVGAAVLLRLAGVSGPVKVPDVVAVLGQPDVPGKRGGVVVRRPLLLLVVELLLLHPNSPVGLNVWVEGGGGRSRDRRDHHCRRCRGHGGGRAPDGEALRRRRRTEAVAAPAAAAAAAVAAAAVVPVEEGALSGRRRRKHDCRGSGGGRRRLWLRRRMSRRRRGRRTDGDLRRGDGGGGAVAALVHDAAGAVDAVGRHQRTAALQTVQRILSQSICNSAQGGIPPNEFLITSYLAVSSLVDPGPVPEGAPQDRRRSPHHILVFLLLLHQVPSHQLVVLVMVMQHDGPSGLEWRRLRGSRRDGHSGRRRSRRSRGCGRRGGGTLLFVVQQHEVLVQLPLHPRQPLNEVLLRVEPS